MAKTWKEVFDAWEPVVARMRNRGLTISEWLYAFPVQIKGQLVDKRPFYFRERNGRAFLGVGGPDPSWTPIESAEETLWPESAPPGEPFLTASQFEPVFDRLLSQLAPTGWHAVHQAWTVTIARLASAGFQIQQRSADPAWLEGTLPTGERFHLRQFPLMQNCFIGVGGDDPENAPVWSVTEEWVEESPLEAPSQRPERAESMLLRAAQQGRSNR